MASLPPLFCKIYFSRLSFFHENQDFRSMKNKGAILQKARLNQSIFDCLSQIIYNCVLKQRNYYQELAGGRQMKKHPSSFSFSFFLPSTFLFPVLMDLQVLVWTFDNGKPDFFAVIQFFLTSKLEINHSTQFRNKYISFQITELPLRQWFHENTLHHWNIPTRSASQI